jgi:cell wall-associated NlpC family hydrolase
MIKNRTKKDINVGSSLKTGSRKMRDISKGTTLRKAISNIDSKIDGMIEDNNDDGINSLNAVVYGKKTVRNVKNAASDLKTTTKNARNISKKVGSILGKKKGINNKLAIDISRRTSLTSNLSGKDLGTGIDSAVYMKNKYNTVKAGVKGVYKTVKNFKKLVEAVKAIITAIKSTALGIKLAPVIAVILIIFLVVGGLLLCILPAKQLGADPKFVLEVFTELIGLKTDFLDELEFAVEHADTFEIIIEDDEDGDFAVDLKAFLAYLAVQYEQDLDGSADEVETIKVLFNNLYDYSTDIKLDKSSGEKVKIAYVKISKKSMEDIFEEENWDQEDIDWYYEIYETIDLNVYDNIDTSQLDATTALFNDTNLQEMINNSQMVGISRKELLEVGRSLIGQVSYFWGGKSEAGWNSLWGTQQFVTSPEGTKSYTYQTYGLDCSGYTDWVYKTASDNLVSLGEGTTYQFNHTYSISESDLKIGDLAFKREPYGSGFNHVGIYSGTKNGTKYFLHCSSSSGVVENSYSGFRFYKRVAVKFEDD